MRNKTCCPALRRGLALVLALCCAFVFFSASAGKPGADNQTEPASTQNQVDHLPSVPEDLKEHFLLQRRGVGPCKTMKGGIRVTLIFVDDADSKWTAAEMEDYRTKLGDGLNRIAAEAWERNVLLAIVTDQKHCAIQESVNSGNASGYADTILEVAGFAKPGEQASVDTPVVFAFNKEGRAFASSRGQRLEYCVLFDDPSPLRHEMYHLFGAADYYYHEELAALAAAWLGETTMVDSSLDTVDDLAAYLVGWTDELTDNALTFLRETAKIAPESLEAARSKNTFTGEGTINYSNGCVYTGDIVLGVAEGWGVLKYPGGDYYEGEFAAGQCHGKGSYHWAGGVVYEGDYVHGEQTGKCKITWPSGNVYEGDVVKGIRAGQGRMTWADGANYVGAFAEGQFHGEGVYTWARGDRYEGDYVMGQRTGYGVMTWSDGTVYKGEFLNGKLHGQGTLTYPSGTVQSGTWNQDQFVG